MGLARHISQARPATIRAMPYERTASLTLTPFPIGSALDGVLFILRQTNGQLLGWSVGHDSKNVAFCYYPSIDDGEDERSRASWWASAGTGEVRLLAVRKGTPHDRLFRSGYEDVSLSKTQVAYQLLL